MKDIITYEDFSKLDLRVGKILEASAPAWSNKLLEFKVDFGAEIGILTILSGIKQWYDPADFVGKKYPFVVNLAPRKMGEGVSQGMMIMADAKEQPVVFPLDDKIEEGCAIC